MQANNKGEHPMHTLPIGSEELGKAMHPLNNLQRLHLEMFQSVGNLHGLDNTAGAIEGGRSFSYHYQYKKKNILRVSSQQTYVTSTGF